MATRILVWGENHHDVHDARTREIYPETMHGTIAGSLAAQLGADARVDTATLDQPEHGLTEERLADTDVLYWWGHVQHHAVDDAIVERVHRHVLSGMGLVVLHSGHFSKIFIRLMGTTCALRWRSDRDREVVWTVDPAHPLARGVPQPFIIDEQEMYGEYFDVPRPDELVFVSGFSGGEVFRSGMTYRRGLGRVFYFSPGDQDFPVYHHPAVQRVLANAASWAAPDRPRELPRLAMYLPGEFDVPREWTGEPQ